MYLNSSAFFANKNNSVNLLSDKKLPIKEMLSKDKRFANKNVKINFDSKGLEKEIKENVNSLKSLLKKK